MADISKVNLPNGNTYNFKDSEAISDLSVSGKTITYTKRDNTTGTITTQDTTYTAASQQAAGLMSASDKNKLDYIAHDEYNARYAIVGSDKADSNGWYKVASGHLEGYDNCALTFFVNSCYMNGGGCLTLDLRCDNTKKITVKKFGWYFRQNTVKPDKFILSTNENEWTLYHYISQNQYYRTIFQLLHYNTDSRLKDQYINNKFYLYRNLEKEDFTDAPDGTESVDLGIVAKAISDNDGNNIKSTYLKDISIDADILTITKGDKTTSNINIKDYGKFESPVVMKKGYKIHHLNGIGGSIGYIKIASINITGSYCNTPISFSCIGRNCNVETKFYIKFNNNNNPDPDLKSFTKLCIDTTSDQYPIEAYIKKSSASNWDLYIDKTKDSWEIFDIIEFTRPEYVESIKIEWKDEQITELPDDVIQASNIFDTSEMLVPAGYKVKTMYGTYTAADKINPSTPGYIKIASITILNAVGIQHPIIIKYINKYLNLAENTLSIVFANTTTTSIKTSIKSFTYYGPVNDSYIVNSSDNIWDIYIRVVSIDYSIDILNFHIPYILKDKINFEWKNEQCTKIPTESRKTPSLAGRVETAFRDINSQIITTTYLKNVSSNSINTLTLTYGNNNTKDITIKTDSSSGTFTPALKYSTSDNPDNFNNIVCNGSGHFVQTNKMVYINMHFEINSTFNDIMPMITGLPFAFNSSNDNAQTVLNVLYSGGYFYNKNDDKTPNVKAHIYNGGTSAYIITEGNTTNFYRPLMNMTTNITTIDISGTYSI